MREDGTEENPYVREEKVMEEAEVKDQWNNQKEDDTIKNRRANKKDGDQRCSRIRHQYLRRCGKNMRPHTYRIGRGAPTA